MKILEVYKEDDLWITVVSSRKQPTFSEGTKVRLNMKRVDNFKKGTVDDIDGLTSQVNDIDSRIEGIQNDVSLYDDAIREIKKDLKYYSDALIGLTKDVKARDAADVKRFQEVVDNVQILVGRFRKHEDSHVPKKRAVTRPGPF